MFTIRIDYVQLLKMMIRNDLVPKIVSYVRSPN